MAWSGFGQMHLVQNHGSKLVCKNHRGPILAEYAISLLPVFHFQTQLCSSTDNQDHIVQNQPRSDLVLADCVKFWPSGSSPESSRCPRIIQPASAKTWLSQTGCELDPARLLGSCCAAARTNTLQRGDKNDCWIE